MSPSGVRFVRFNLVGVAGVAVQVGVLTWLADGLGVWLHLATPLSVAAAVVHNFIWHVRWTWRDRQAGRLPTIFAKFAAGNGAVSLAGNTLLVPLLAGRIGMPTPAAALVAIAACGLFNFVLADRLVFLRDHARVP